MAKRREDDDLAGDGEDSRIGHNSNRRTSMEQVDSQGGVAAGELRQFIERIERLEEEKQAIADDIKDVMTELKGQGYDAKTVRAILKLRKQDPDERAEAEAILELYMNALGMI